MSEPITSGSAKTPAPSRAPETSGPSPLVKPHTAKPEPTAVARSSGTVAVMSSACWNGHERFVKKLRSTNSAAAIVKTGATTISASVPQSEILRYATDLRALTQGRGTYTMHFSHYQEVPSHVAQGLVEKLKAEHDQK